MFMDTCAPSLTVIVFASLLFFPLKLFEDSVLFHKLL